MVSDNSKFSSSPADLSIESAVSSSLNGQHATLISTRVAALRCVLSILEPGQTLVAFGNNDEFWDVVERLSERMQLKLQKCDLLRDEGIQTIPADTTLILLEDHEKVDMEKLDQYRKANATQALIVMDSFESTIKAELTSAGLADGLLLKASKHSSASLDQKAAVVLSPHKSFDRFMKEERYYAGCSA